MRAEHHAIATAIAERDEASARARVRQHLDRTRRVIFRPNGGPPPATDPSS